jgi:hypothetical protein
MSYDADVMAAIAEELYEFHVDAAHGAQGTDALRAVLRTIRELYLFRSPDSFPEGLVVFRGLPAAATLVDPQGSVDVADVRGIDEFRRGAVIEVLDSQLRVWPRGTLDPLTLALGAVAYVFSPPHDGDDLANPEAIVLPQGLKAVRNPVGYASAFAPPTFWNLEDALDYYASGLAARATCKILRTVWAVDAEDRRLVLANHPEVIMRESIAQHLRSTLRDTKLVRVNEEQNVSETEPVDIEVTWSLTSQIALIEVKWLGRCLNEDATDLASYTYADARARHGVKQLREYLDEFRERTPGHEIKGYLVVLDARRRGVTSWQPGTVTHEQAWYYRDREIDFQDAIPDREDFRPPRRVYLEPRMAA